VLLLIVFSTTSLGLVIGANMRSEEGFGLVMNFVIWPLFFFSGALFQVSNLPDILKIASSIDPITYAVDALRIVMLGTGSFPLYFDIAVLFGFAAVAAILGIISFGNLQQVK
jgi:ABC-2 type transport system permease protein